MTMDLYRDDVDRALSWETGVPAEAYDSGAEDAFWSAFDEMRHVANTNAQYLNEHEYIQNALDTLKAETGETIPNPYRRYYSERRDDDGSLLFHSEMAKMRKRFDELRAARPDLHLPDLTDPAIKTGGIEVGRRYESAVRANQFQRQNGSFTSGAASFLGTMAGAMTDPVNAALMLVPGGQSRTIAGAAVRGAAVNATSQAAVTGLAYDYRRQIDPGYTYQSAVEEILAAAVGGALFEGGAKAISRAIGLGGQAAQRIKTRRLKDAEAIVSRETFNRASIPPGTPRTQQAATAHTAAVAQAERQISLGLPVTQGIPAQGRSGRVIDASGREINVNYGLVEARDLITSHTDDLAPDPRFPAALQPRDRTRAASQEQINKIAAELKPEWLGMSPRSDSGAPIVGPDGIVESGNGRVLALRRAYQRNGGAASNYRQFLREQGFEGVEQMREPVLVARRATDLTQADREKFVHASNTSAVARMSQGEQALADARLLTPELVATADRYGPYSSEFAKAIFKGMPQEERAGLIDRYGVLSNEGIRRIQGMLLGRAYGDAAFLGRALEDADGNIKAIAGAMTDAAPKWAALRQDVSSGRVEPSLDVTNDLIDAVRLVMRARDDGIKIADLMNQSEMFGGPSNTAKMLVRNFFSNGDMTRQASRARIAKFLNEFADEARKADAGPRLLGDALTPEQVLATALQKADREDLLPLIEQATTPEAAEKMATSRAVEIDDQILMEANRLMMQDKNLKVSIPDGKGGEEERLLAEVMDEIDREIEAADTINACVTGTAEKEAAS